jgi:1-acyl-sn-glycerol-3-phosphate acyltransferase
MRTLIQRLSHWLGGIALHWFYSDVRVLNSDRIPARGPILIAMNHQNALVDAILALWIVPRELRLTAKATLGDSMPGALLLKTVGVIPLRRASDADGANDPIRNRRAFQEMIDELGDGGAILVFPEGKSHNEPDVAPLKTGLARVALWAREAGVRNIQIVPIGITFANKAEPDTVVLAQVGEPIRLDDWNGEDSRELTSAVAARLRAVSFAEITEDGSRHTTVPRSLPVRLAAWWGRLTHTIPLRIARHQAIRLSEDEGEPAMYTITLGFAAILISYAIEVPIVCWLFGRMAALIFFVSLVTGAYWAAYAHHSPEQSRE